MAGAKANFRFVDNRSTAAHKELKKSGYMMHQGVYLTMITLMRSTRRHIVAGAAGTTRTYISQ